MQWDQQSRLYCPPGNPQHADDNVQKNPYGKPFEKQIVNVSESYILQMYLMIEPLQTYNRANILWTIVWETLFSRITPKSYSAKIKQ